jgi:hypothetical protein
MLKRILGIAAALAVPTLLAAQTPIPANDHAAVTGSKTIPAAQASDTARSKVAQAMARRATRVRGQAVGLDNRPVTPAMRPTIAQPGAGPGGRAIPATAATPASPSRKPSDPGAGHSGRP